MNAARNVTRALLRRDLPWMFVWAVIGAAALVTACESRGFANAWVLPRSRGSEVFQAGWALGLGLGLFAAFWEPMLGTRELVLHRPVAPARLVGGRLLSLLLVVVGWFLLTPLSHFVVELGFGRLASLFEIRNLGWFGVLLLPALGSAAVGFWAGTLPCAMWVRLVIAAGTQFFALVGIWQVYTASGSLGLYAVLQIAVGALFAGLALHGAGTIVDVDRPLPASFRRGSGPIALLAMAGGLSLLIGLWGSEQLATLARITPQVAMTSDGPRLVAWKDDRYYERVFVGDDHESTGVAGPELGKLESLWSRYGIGRTADPEFDQPRRHVVDGFELVLSGGEVHALRYQWDRAATHLVLRKDDGSRFGEDAREVTFDGDNGRLHGVVEPGTAAVWLLDLTAGRLVPVPLPGGDRVDRMAWVRPDRGLADTRIETDAGRYVLEERSREVVVGQRGVYQWRDGALQAAEPWQVAAARRDRADDEAPGVQAVVLDDNPLAPHLQVRHGDEVVFDHVFSARTWAERWQLSLRLCSSAAMPPLLQAVAFALPVVPAGQRGSGLFDPMVRGGRNAWILLLNVVLGALCAFGATRRLRRLGADGTTARWWAVAIALTGPIGLLASVVVERPRAYAPATAGEPAKAGPLPRIGALSALRP